jgi:hypothetical protein
MGRNVVLLLLGLAGAAACGGQGTEVEEPVSPTEGGEAGAAEPAGERVSAIAALGLTPPEPPWAEMSEFDREMYMVGKVQPIMHEIFARHDPERYATFQCEACHGEDMREVEFRMPSARMYRIPREGTPAYRSMLDTFGPTVRFMEEEVTPTMAAIMGQPDLDCSSCHPTAE